MLYDFLVVRQITRSNPAHSVRGPKYVVKKGKTPVWSREDAKTLQPKSDRFFSLRMQADQGRHPAPGIEQNTEDRSIALSRMSFNESGFIESKNATTSASSKTRVWEDSRTSLGGLARAAGLYSATPRIISESKATGRPQLQEGLRSFGSSRF